ncbi:MAG: ABC transporter substrate-binding protein [Hyphomicrobiaceae bacterium]|nr:ABC transporter substrate-binding protein [Hyphomicrobiaceae bacterium]
MRRLTLTLIAIFSTCGPLCAEPRTSVAMHGTPKLATGFDHLPYVNPDAPKGGRIRLGNLGSFDNVNPLVIKGEQAAGVREFSIEPLMARDLDEPFTLHGLLAQTIDIADDRKSVTFAMNPKARFSDRSPVTVDDVLFSFEMLKTKGRLNHRTYFAKVVSAERVSDTQVRFTFADASDRELPLILGLMPVFSKAATNPDTFEQTTMTPLVGSGPYTITHVDPGRSLTYTRDPDYWAKDEPVSRGRFNFDEIQFDYYRESTAMFEAFKSGLIDLRLEEDPSNWAGSYEFAAVRDGRIIKAAFDIGLPAGMTALAFNTRRDVFKNPKVRQALIMLFDFEWINRTLYNGLYKRTESYFERSYLSSAGKPADATERSLLAPYEARVKPEIMAGTYRFSESDGSGQNRANQRRAFDLLKEAGYELRGGKLVDKASGKPLRFEILAHNQAQETLLAAYARSLAPLGINARVRVIDSAQYQRRLNAYDYDMIQTTWASSLSPGNEQLFRWSSANATAPATWNYAGVQNEAVDAMIAALLAAESEDTFVSSVRALDRVLLSGDYVVPMFYVPNQWVAHWARLKHPDKTPLFGYALDTWWIEEKK